LLEHFTIPRPLFENEERAFLMAKKGTLNKEYDLLLNLIIYE